MKKKRICVIGAGPSGIAALKNLLDEGLKAVAFDRNYEVGGNWIFSEAESHSSVFDTTHIISSKTLSQYDDFTFEDFATNVADYPSHSELRQYFQAYARHFDLYPHIEFETMVLHCKRLDEETWEVQLEKHGVQRTEYFTDLVVCNGHHWLPRMPQYPGDFTGEFLHSHAYKRAAPFADKRVLVIGGGNSACDVAVETSRVSARTTISWRRGYYIVPKFIMGKPADVIGKRLNWLPTAIRQKVSAWLVRLINGSNRLYGLPEPDVKFGATHPTINEELFYRIRHGKIHPKPDIQRFEGHTVYFKDGSCEDFDSIIACTGYVLAHPFFAKDFLDYSSGPVPLYLKMLHPEYHNLYFIGMFQPLGCIWPGAELQSKIMARELAGKWQRPQNIRQLCEREVTHPHYRQIDTPRHTITVDYHRFRKDLLKHLPKDYIRKTAQRAPVAVDKTL
ncbi:MAG: flavin-containing monooxygenase [Saprospiraceae bacterium]